MKTRMLVLSAFLLTACGQAGPETPAAMEVTLELGDGGGVVTSTDVVPTVDDLEQLPAAEVRWFRSVMCGRVDSTPSVGAEITRRRLHVPFPRAVRQFVDLQEARSTLGWLCVLDTRPVTDISRLPSQMNVAGAPMLWQPARHREIHGEAEARAVIVRVTEPEWPETLDEAACEDLHDLYLTPNPETSDIFMEEFLETGSTEAWVDASVLSSLADSVAARCRDSLP